MTNENPNTLEDYSAMKRALEITAAELDIMEAQAKSPHRAIATWWARTLLPQRGKEGNISTLCNHIGTPERTALIQQVRNHRAQRLMGRMAVVVDAIEGASASLGDRSSIQVDYYPENTLVRALESAGVEVDPLLDFPFKSYTVLSDGVALGARGSSSPEIIWPATTRSSGTTHQT